MRLLTVDRSLDCAILIVGEKNIQKRKDSILFFLHRELDVIVHIVEMVMEAGH